MKLSPFKENAAASAFDVLEVVVAEGLAGAATLDKLVEDTLFSLLVTDN